MSEDYVKNIINFLYIAAFLLGISGITLAVLLSKRYKQIIYYKLKAFCIAFFLYEFMNFLFFYRAYFFLKWEMNVVMMFINDIFFVVLLYTWAELIGELAGCNTKKMILKALGVFYVIAWLPIYLFLMDKDYNIQNIFGKILAVSSDTIILSTALWYNLTYTMKGIKILDSLRKRSLLVISTAMISYILLFYLEDLSLIFYPFLAVIFNIYPFDPVIVVYLLLNIFMIVFIYKKELLFQDTGLDDNDFSDTDGNVQHSLEEIGKRFRLTDREREMLILVYQGYSNSKIADILCISLHTVKRHINNIFRKMEVNTRVELIHLIISGR